MNSNVSFFRRIGSISYDLFLVFSFVFFIAGIIILINNKEPITNPFFFLSSYLASNLFIFFNIVGKGQTNSRDEGMENLKLFKRMGAI